MIIEFHYLFFRFKKRLTIISQKLKNAEKDFMKNGCSFFSNLLLLI